MPTPRLRTTLRLETLDGRIVPSGTPDAPLSDTSTPALSTLTTDTYTFSIQTGDFVYAGNTGGLDLFFTVDGQGLSWLYAVDPNTQQYTALLTDADAAYDPASWDGVSSGFQRSPENWNLVWNTTDRTWTTVAPGAMFDTAAMGAMVGGWNVVVLPAGAQPPVVPPVGPAPNPVVPPVGPAPNPQVVPPVGPVQNPPANPPANPPQVTITVTVNGNTVTVTGPAGTGVTVTPTPGGGVTVVTTPPGGQGTTPNPIKIPPADPLPPPDDITPPPTKPPLPWWHPDYVPPGINLIPIAPPPRPVIMPQ